MAFLDRRLLVAKEKLRRPQAQRIVAYYRQRFTRGARFVAFGKWEWDARRNTFALRLNKPDELEMLPGTFTPPENALIRLAEQGETQNGSGGADFDAVFTDIGMKGMSGWELARAIRERDGAMPLAVITGWGDAVGSGERSAARVDWVVTKPFDAAQVLAIAREVARRAAGRNKSAATAA